MCAPEGLYASSVPEGVLRGLSLSPPPPALEVVKDNLVTAAGRDHLPVATTKRTVRPPSILHQPRLADRVDIASIDHQRRTTVACCDGHAARDG